MVGKAKKATVACIVGGLIAIGGYPAFASNSEASSLAQESPTAAESRERPPADRDDHDKDREAHRRGRHGNHPGRRHDRQRNAFFGKVTDVDDHSFSLATRRGEVKVRWDSDTKFKGGESSDLDEGVVVGVKGDRDDDDRVDADVIFFPKHDRGRHHR